jgi:hypothetical protein
LRIVCKDYDGFWLFAFHLGQNVSSDPISTCVVVERAVPTKKVGKKPIGGAQGDTIKQALDRMDSAKQIVTAAGAPWEAKMRTHAELASGLAIALAVLLSAPDPRVTQATIHDTICQRGYTKTVRPPAKWTSRIKRQMLHGQRTRDFELDHIIPLEVGGAPMDLRNLQLQRWPDAKRKDKLENNIHRAVCSGRMTLQQGQAIFVGSQQ